MSDHHACGHASCALLVLTLLAFSVGPCLGLCESRCERSIEALIRLRELWSRSFKRVGDQDVSFNRFLTSMLLATIRTNTPETRQFRQTLLNVIARYQDCVVACEHQFSKRSGRSRPRSVSSSIVLNLARKKRLLPLLSLESSIQINHVT